MADGPGSVPTFGSFDLTANNTVILDSPRTLSGITFGDANPASPASWIISPGDNPDNALTFAVTNGLPIVTVNALGTNAAVTIAAPVGSASGLVKAGPGTLVLTAPNVYGGATNVAGGTLNLVPGGALTTTTIDLATSTRFNLAGGTLNASDLVTVNASGSPTTSANFIVDSGTASVGGLHNNSNDGAVMRVNGGTLNAGSVTFQRGSYGTTPAYALGFIVACASANDLVSGAAPVDLSISSGSTFSLGTTTVTVSAKDAAGNTSTGTFKVNVRDTTKPTLTLPANMTLEATSPAGTVATYTASAADTMSSNVSVNFSVASGSTFAPGTTTVMVTATDAAGNKATGTFTVTVVDTTGPFINVPAQPVIAVAAGTAGTVVNFAATAQDVVDGAVAVTYAPKQPGEVFAPGQTLITVTATDAHGNQSQANFVVWVQFAWSGYLQPINVAPSPVSIFKLGRTVPVKFTLAGASAGITNATARLSFRKWNGEAEGDVNEADSTSAATVGDAFRYDASSGQYIFNWDTKPLASNAALGKGTYALFVNLGDGVQHAVLVSLKD